MSTYIWLMTETGFGTMLAGALALGAIIYGIYLSDRNERRRDEWLNGQDATLNASWPSSSQPTATPATSAKNQAQQQLTMSSLAVAAAVTRSRTYGQPTPSVTADAETDPCSGSVQGTPRTSSTLNSQSTSGLFLTADPRETARRPVRFFSSKKNASEPEKPRKEPTK